MEVPAEVSKEGENSSSSSSSRHPNRYIGIHQRPSGRWAAEVKDSQLKLRRWLGTFETPEDAACAYDEAVRALRGPNARTNFSLTTSSGAGSDDASENMEPFSFEDGPNSEDLGLVGALKDIIERRDRPGRNLMQYDESINEWNKNR